MKACDVYYSSQNFEAWVYFQELRSVGGDREALWVLYVLHNLEHPEAPKVMRGNVGVTGIPWLEACWFESIRDHKAGVLNKAQRKWEYFK